MYYLGIDNGLNGGLVLIDENEMIIQKHVMPFIQGKKKEFDVTEINNIIHRMSVLSSRENEKPYGFLEEARVQPVSGKRASFTTGLCYGMFQGFLTAYEIPYEIVAPKTWQKELLKGLASDTKVASIMFSQRKYPKVDWTPTERSRKAHDGLTDACCIAIYGKRMKGDKK